MREPHFWRAGLDPRSRESAPLTRAMLTPLASLYAAVTASRIRKAKPDKVSAAVICVGNLTVGGVGKSPVVQALRAYLETKTGKRIAVLSRGYGGRLKGPVRVDLDRHDANDVGDEPLMHAMQGEAWIGADRAAAGRAMCEAGVDIILMDDGHQNPRLFKDISLVVVDRAAGFGNGFVVPKGPLREPVKTGLARADGIILTGEGAPPNAVGGADLPVLETRLMPVSQPEPGPFVAFAGIGRPEKFFDTLKAMGVDVRDSVPFADHHVYSRADLSYLHRLAADNGARLITTRKDYCRLKGDQRQSISALDIKVQFDAPDLLDKLLAPVMKPAPS